MYKITSVPSFGMHTLTKLQNTEGVRYIKYQVPEGKPDSSINKDSVYCCNIAEIAVYGDASQAAPTVEPTVEPTAEPTVEPTVEPTTEPTTEPSPEKVKGDVNNDGALNTTDLVALSSFILGKDAVVTAENADLNSDGKIDVTDIIKIAAHIKGKKLIE